jgi:hypothetical protein
MLQLRSCLLRHVNLHLLRYTVAAGAAGQRLPGKLKQGGPGHSPGACQQAGVFMTANKWVAITWLGKIA